MGGNVDLPGGLIDVGAGAAAEGQHAAALSARDAIVAPPPDELSARNVGGPGVVQENNAESKAHPGPIPAPGLAAILQHLQAIAAAQDALGPRISHVEQIQAHQQVQLQQAQLVSNPANPGLQPVGGILAGGQPVLGGHGLIAAQPLPPPQGPSEQAAFRAAAKAHGKVTADLWRPREGQKFYVARGCFHVSEGMSHGLVCHVLTTVAGALDGAVE